MAKLLKKLHLRQIDGTLKAYRKLLGSEVPRRGWIREIRRALGMTTAQLAERMGITASTVTALERSETEGVATLKSMRRAADALGCELFYVLIPRQPLKDTVEKRARQVAKDRLDKVAHTMRLEEQSLSAEDLKEQFDDLVREMSEHPTSELWANQ